MIAQRHGVGDNFDAVIQRAVVLAVGVLLLGIGSGQEDPGVAAKLTGSVYLQLYAKVTVAFAIEDGVWFVRILMDGLSILGVMVAFRAKGFTLVTVISGIERVIVVNWNAAADAAAVIAVIATLAKRCIVIPGIVIPVDTLPASGAEDCFLYQTALTQLLFVKYGTL